METSVPVPPQRQSLCVQNDEETPKNLFRSSSLALLSGFTQQQIGSWLAPGSGATSLSFENVNRAERKPKEEFPSSSGQVAGAKEPSKVKSVVAVAMMRNDESGYDSDSVKTCESPSRDPSEHGGALVAGQDATSLITPTKNRARAQVPNLKRNTAKATNFPHPENDPHFCARSAAPLGICHQYYNKWLLPPFC